MNIQVVQHREHCPSIETTCERCVRNWASVFCKNHIGHLNAMCGQSAAWLVLNPVRILTIKLLAPELFI